MYLWFVRHNSDTVFTALEFLIADERSDVNRDFHATIFSSSFHGKLSEREREREKKRNFRENLEK